MPHYYRNLKDVYQEALRLHKISWIKRQETKGVFNFKKFDNSHLPKGYNDPDVHVRINRKLQESISNVNFFHGKFRCHLTFNEALILLIKVNMDNINYARDLDIDLLNYRLGSSTFEILIK